MNKVSVVTCVNNGSKFLEPAIRGILNQSYKNFEFIILDDGSKDNTWNILQEYSRVDRRIKLLRNRNSIGLTKSLNIAINYAKGIYIARMDADDMCVPERLEEQLIVIRDDLSTALVCSWITIIDENGVELLVRKLPPSRWVRNYFKFENLICHGSVMFRKSIFDRLGGYNTYLRYGQDRDLWQRIFDAGGGLYIVPKPLYKFRVSTTNISITEKNNFSEKDKAANVFHSRQVTWLASLYLQQKKGKEANKILRSLLFTKQNFIMKIVYFIVSFLPHDFVTLFMYDLRPRARLVFKTYQI